MQFFLCVVLDRGQIAREMRATRNSAAIVMSIDATHLLLNGEEVKNEANFDVDHRGLYMHVVRMYNSRPGAHYADLNCHDSCMKAS